MSRPHYRHITPKVMKTVAHSSPRWHELLHTTYEHVTLKFHTCYAMDTRGPHEVGQIAVQLMGCFFWHHEFLVTVLGLHIGMTYLQVHICFLKFDMANRYAIKLLKEGTHRLIRIEPLLMANGKSTNPSDDNTPCNDSCSRFPTSGVIHSPNGCAIRKMIFITMWSTPHTCCMHQQDS